jgi:predicted NBD/HSP70 family sugar kinase
MTPSLLLQLPKVPAPLDAEFRPAALGSRAFSREVERSGGGVPLELALERNDGLVARHAVKLLPEGHPNARDNLPYAERLVKMLLWQKGGFRLWIFGSPEVAAHLRATYREGGARDFDARFMAKVFEQPAFECRAVDALSDLPAEREAARSLGGHFGGCRIGFDAGGSDRKVAAVIDGKEVFSSEVVWFPKENADPEYHLEGIAHSLTLAARHLPRVDAVGVSSAGIFVNNRAMVASLFRKIPERDFHDKIKNAYLDVPKKLFGEIPVEVCNDGDVTALAGAMDLHDTPVLGIAMGTSEAAGYVNRDGMITGLLNELAFAPLDFSPQAPRDDEWSGDSGIGSQYLSQDAVVRLAARARLNVDAALSPAEQLKQVQELLSQGDERARRIYETLGVYLGYALLYYSAFYEVKHVLLLGRVMSGVGGGIIVEKAREVLLSEDPGLAQAVHLSLPDEAKRRVGQAVAAASLPRAFLGGERA